MNEIAPISTREPLVLDHDESPTIGKIAGALAKAQGMMSNAPLDKVNPHFKSRYASLAAVLDAIRAALSSNGIAFIQPIRTLPDGKIVLLTKLIHESGEWLSGEFPLTYNANPQVMGSNTTYARRYCISTICGLSADDDDDANVVKDDGKAKADQEATRKKAQQDAAKADAAALKKTQADAKAAPQPEPEDIDPKHPWRAFGAPEPGETPDAPHFDPPKNGADVNWTVWGAWFRAQVICSGNPAYLDGLVESHGPILEYIKKKYPQSFEGLIEAVNARRGQVGKAAEPTTLAQDLDDDIPF